MKRYIFFNLLLIFTFVFTEMYSQNHQRNDTNKNRSAFVDLYFGTQVSGIRKEDYVSSNFTPYFQFTIGNWFSPYLALAVNY